jgi:ribosomal RNA-processing protein 36
VNEVVFRGLMVKKCNYQAVTCQSQAAMVLLIDKHQAQGRSLAELIRDQNVQRDTICALLAFAPGHMSRKSELAQYSGTVDQEGQSRPPLVTKSREPSDDASDVQSGTNESEDAASDSDASNASDDVPRPEDDVVDVSFGTLVKAQELLGPRERKRKRLHSFDDETASRPDEVPEKVHDQGHFLSAKRPQKISRQSKHAPAIISSRQQVSRKREIFEPSPALKARDPRFDATVMSSNHNKNATDKANKNYAFLTSYQASEILDLKARIKKTKDPSEVAELKRKVMSVESRIRNAEARQRESEIVKQHNHKERQAIQAGQKANPYYLKPGEVKKQAEADRLQGMGKKARDKAEARKKKREKSKDAKSMPRFRREG